MKDSHKDFDQSRTLLNSRQKLKRSGQQAESMRQSNGMMNMDPSIRTNEASGGLGSYTQKPQESEEDKIARYERIIEKLK
mmetsp:Transcript_2490/g.3230  ORF Transcript_2490/g.3230 Transcript_2490/m.3230 type:complete len:80 (-) Transcript_2490:364-603(-)